MMKQASLLGLSLAFVASAMANSPEAKTTSPVLFHPLPEPIAGVKIQLGNEVLFDDPTHLERLKGKRIGLVTNPSAKDSRFELTIDKMVRHPDLNVTALFAPEHGVRGAQAAGEDVESGIDTITGLPVFSLHGRDANGRPKHRPTTESLALVDVLVYEIQDIGNRSYTYIGTLIECMIAAKEQGKEVVVLDRPNPLGGDWIDGNVLDPSRLTLVGWAPVPYLYGMTSGEIAKWLNSELETTVSGKRQNIGVELHVVPMKGWSRSMTWNDTGLPWIPTSTHMQTAAACWHIAFSGYMGELRTISEGVGFPAPFEYVGTPFIDGVWLANELNARQLPGVIFRPVEFRPFYGTFTNEMVYGVQAIVTDFRTYRPVEAGLHLAELLVAKYPEKDILLTKATERRERLRADMFDKVMGDPTLRARLTEGVPAREIAKEWEQQRKEWLEKARRYHLYR